MSEIVSSAVIQIDVDASGAEVGLRKVNDAVTNTGRTVDSIGKGDGFTKLGSEAERAANRVTAAEARMIASIQRRTVAEDTAGKGAAAFYEARAKLAGIDTTGALAPYLAQLRAVEASQKAANVALGAASPALAKVGVSAAQTAAALRGVPAQFTDIITSIQGGQAPLTVFLQQGGQLKDMFGGAGNAARALGGYVVGLINPLTIAAAAAATLAVAYNQGSKEADAYNRAIIMTGNAAGVTAGQLADMSARISNSAGTQGQAAAAVAAIADTGRVSANNIERFSKVAADSQRVLGIAVGDTAKAFADLGKNPVATLERLNETYRFLTPAVYDQVKALEAQGRADEAASAAQGAFASAMETRTKGVKENLGSLETAWKNLGSIIPGVWDKMLDVGREETLTKKLANVQAQIEKAQKSASKPFDASFGGNAEVRAQLAANLKIEASLKGQIKLETEAAAAASATNKKREAGLEWSKEGEKFTSRAIKMERELAAARNTAIAAGISLDSKVYKDRIAAISASYADKGAVTAINKEASAYATLTAAINERISATSREVAGLDPLTESQKLQIKLNDDIRTGALKLAPALKAEYEAKIKQLGIEEKLLVQKKQIDVSNAASAKVQADYASRLGKSVADANKEAEANEELARTYGLSKSAIEALTIARLEEQAERVRAIDGAHDEAEALDLVIAAKKRSAAALSSVDTQEATKKANKAMTDEWEKTVEKYEDVFRTGFADMLNKGKDGWKSFTTSLVTTFKTSVADQIYKMFAQPFVIKLVGSLLGVTGGAIAGAASAASGGGEGGSAAGSALSGLGAIGSLASGAGLLGAGGLGLQAGFGALMSGGLAGVSAAVSGGVAAIGAGTAASIAAGMGTIAGALGPIALGIAGTVALLNKAFGRGPKEATGTTLNGMFGADGFSGTTDEAWVKKGGWFRSDKTGVDSTAIDAATAKQFGAGYDALKAASADFAQVLGINADAIKNRAQSLSIDITKDEEANKKAIADFFAGVGNTIAKELLPTISDFAKEGEGASATLQRLATNYATIDAALSALSLSFGAVGVESLSARERLVTLSGGIETLVQNAAGFAQNYLTEAERLAPVASMVAKSMADLGFASIDTRDEFKALVQSLDLTTESGATNYAALMKLQGAFAEVAKASEVAADAAITNAKATAAAAIESAKASAAGLLAGVDDAFGVLQRVSNAEKDRLTKAHEVAMKRLQIGIDTETAAIAKTRALSDSINSTISQISGGPDRATAQAQIQTAIAMAKAGGVLPSADSLKDALSVLSRDSGQFATLQEFQRDQYQTQNSLAELGKLTDSALSVEEKTLAALEAQKEAAQAAYESEIGRLDEVVSAAQSQIDILKGIDTTGLTIVQALEALRTAILSAQGNSVSGSTSAITDAYKSALGRMPDSGGLAYFQDKAAAGASVSDIVSGIKNSPEAQVQAAYKELLGRNADAGGLDYFLKSGGSIEAIRAALMQSDEYKKKLRGFAVGTNYLPQTMPILAHEGERIIPAADNRALMAMLSKPAETNSELASAVGRLTAEVEGLRSEARATAVHTAKTAKLLDRVIKNDKLSTESA